MEEVFTVEEVAKYLKVTPTTIYRMLEDGRLTGFKIGASWRIRESDITAYIERSQGGKADE